MAHPIRRSLLALLVAPLLSIVTVAVPEAGAQCTVTLCTSCPADPTCAACTSGYIVGGGGTVCTDVNECAVSNGSCGAGFTCTNQPGTRDCNDINECATNAGGCAPPPSGSCTNTAGSRTCACSSGYTGNGITCTDVNECATTNGGCSTSPVVTCTNTAGSRTCGPCPGGYAGNGVTCTDVNECAVNNGGCAAPPGGRCDNAAGSFSCSCNSGFTGGSCNDINECATANGGCSPLAGCTNDPGTYACGACPSGYTGNGFVCTDINDCADNNNGSCDPLTTCTNTPGSRTCGACPGGYTGTGDTACSDVNECLTNSGGCSSGFTCDNQPGSHECLDVNECATNNACNAGTCTNDEGTFACDCPSGVTGTTCDVNGYVPPDKPTAQCAKAVSDNIVKYVKCLTKCRTQKAGKALGGKEYDEQACASGPKSCRSAYDKKMLSLVEAGTCPACLDQTAQSGLADDALSAILSTKGATYCAGTVPLEP